MMPEILSTSGSDTPTPQGGTKDATARQVAIALVLLVAGFVGADLIAGHLLDRMFAKSSLNPVAGFRHAKANAVILGASGGKYALDPDSLGGQIYNAAENGQSGYYVAAFLNALPPNTVKRVIYAFDPIDVYTGLAGGNVKHLARFSPWAARDPQLKSWLSHGKPLEQVKLLSAFYRYRGISGGVIRRWIRPKWSTDGYKPLSGQMKLKINQQQPARNLFQPSPSGLAMLDTMANAVARQRSELVILTTPAFESDRANLPQYAPLMDAMRSAFSGLRVCDLTTARDPRLRSIYRTHTLYTDGAHMNGEGARIYSTVVRDLIVSHCGKVEMPSVSVRPGSQWLASRAK